MALSSRCAPYIALVVLGVCSSGCGDPSSASSPLGDQVELYGEWDVNGAVPTEASCARAGIDEVEVVFSQPDGSGPIPSPSFRWPCAAGYFDSGVTRVLQAGSFAYRWRAYHGADAVLESRLYGYSVGEGDELSLMPVDFERHEPVTVDFTLSFATDTGYGGCAEATVSEGLSWALHSGSTIDGPIVASSGGTFGCTSTVHVSDSPTGILLPGAHSLEVNATATDGAHWAGSCLVSVPDGGPVTAVCSVPRAP